MSSLLFDSSVGAIAVAAAVGCLTLVATLVVLGRPRHSWIRGRMEVYERAGTAATGVDAGPGWRPAAERIVGATDRRLERSRLWLTLMLLLERAGSRKRPAELLYTCLLFGLGVAAIVGLASGQVGLAVLALLLSSPLPIWWTATKARRRLTAFEDQLPDVLMTMAGSLRVGLSFNQAMESVVADGEAPAREEFERALQEAQMGRPLTDALAAMGARLGSDDLRFVLMSVAIQNEIGGNLADLFQTVSETVRERQQFRRKVKALTATGRISARVLIGLPVGTALLLTIFSRDYMRPMWTTTTGTVLIGIMALMTFVGWLFVRKIVSIKG